MNSLLASWPLLSILIWLPIVGGVFVLLAGDRNARKMSLALSIATFVLSIFLFTGADVATSAMQFSERALWVDTFNVYYHIGIDGFSLPLILLTTFTTVLVVLAGWEVITYRISQYMAAFLIMEGLMIGKDISLAHLKTALQTFLEKLSLN
jgi:NADH-quinone oxidoreductase subunit M